MPRCKKQQEVQTNTYKRPRKVLSLVQKEEILKKMKQGVSMEKLINEYKTKPSTLYGLKERSQDLQRFRDQHPNDSIRKTFKMSPFPELDTALKIWCQQQQNESLPLHNILIKKKAMEFYDSLYSGVENRKPFKASNGYIQKFCKRYEIKTTPMKTDKVRVAETRVGDMLAGHELDFDEQWLWSDLDNLCNSVMTNDEIINLARTELQPHVETVVSDNLSPQNSPDEQLSTESGRVEQSIQTETSEIVHDTRSNSTEISRVMEAASTLIDWAEDQDDITLEQLTLLRTIKEKVSSKLLYANYKNCSKKTLISRIQKWPQKL